MLNFNADIMAGEIAAAVRAAKLVFLTDVAGICNGVGQLIPSLSTGEAEALVTSGVASGGMIPKIKASLKALDSSTIAYVIDGRKPHALLKKIEGRGGGTIIHGVR
jgi:acetylglutamate kinase